MVLDESYSGKFLKTIFIKNFTKFDKNFEVFGKPSGTMDGEFIIQYIKKIILPYYGANKAILIMDGFKTQKSEEAIKIMRDGINCTFLTPRTTSYHQHINVNDPFKNAIKD